MAQAQKETEGGVSGMVRRKTITATTRASRQLPQCSEKRALLLRGAARTVSVIAIRTLDLRLACAGAVRAPSCPAGGTARRKGTRSDEGGAGRVPAPPIHGLIPRCG